LVQFPKQRDKIQQLNLCRTTFSQNCIYPMSLLDFELEEVRKLLKNGTVIEHSRLVLCDHSLIRIEIEQNISRKLIVILRFPENYPNEIILIELKSKTLDEKVLDSFVPIFENYCKDFLGKPQVIPLLKFIAKTLEDNPLCICYDEIIRLKKLLETTSGELKLKQKKATVSLTARGGQYYFNINVVVPVDYPHSRPTWEGVDTNIPGILQRFLNGQAKEIVRRCVEPPLRPGKQEFKVRPSLFLALSFIVEAVKDFHQEVCPVCKNSCLPQSPVDVITNEGDNRYVERAFCGHLYHAGCLKKYFREPPFVEGGKLCAAKSKHARPDGKGRGSVEEGCGQRLIHDKWALDPKKAELRWAHKKARDRELEEVVDFLK